MLRQWDIDQVAVGLGGALVVQTKWGSDEAAVHDLAAVATKLKSDAENVRLMLKARLGNTPVRAVVVIWGPAARQDAAVPSTRSVAYRALAVAAGATCLAGFDPDETIWLTDVITGCRMADPWRTELVATGSTTARGHGSTEVRRGEGSRGGRAHRLVRLTSFALVRVGAVRCCAFRLATWITELTLCRGFASEVAGLPLHHHGAA